MPLGFGIGGLAVVPAMMSQGFWLSASGFALLSVLGWVSVFLTYRGMR